MYFLINEMIDTLKAAPSMAGVKVAETYAASEMKAPMVTVSEEPGPGYLHPDGKPRVIRTLFQVEVYAKQGNGKPATQNARELMDLATTVINTRYGLTQSGQARFAPYMEDQSVIRGVVLYYAVIDTETNIIYRYV